MALTVSRQMIEVLCAANVTTTTFTDTAPDTLTFQEAFKDTGTRHCGDTLVLTDSTRRSIPWFDLAHDTLALSESFVSIGPRSVGAVDHLPITDSIYQPVSYSVSCADSLSFSESFRSGHANVSFTDTIVLTSDAFETQTRPRGLVDQLAFVEVFDDSPWPTVRDRLTLTEGFSLDRSYPTLQVVDALQTVTYSFDWVTLTEVAAYTGLQDTFAVYKVSSPTVSDRLLLTESFAGTLIKASASPVAYGDTLTLSEQFSRTFLGSYPDFLTLLESNSAAISKGLLDTLSFSEHFSLTRSRRKTTRTACPGRKPTWPAASTLKPSTSTCRAAAYLR